jgi:hypothetical protein
MFYCARGPFGAVHHHPVSDASGPVPFGTWNKVQAREKLDHVRGANQRAAIGGKPFVNLAQFFG